MLRGRVRSVSSDKPTDAEKADARSEAFERAYRESHPNGPYPPVEDQPKQTDERSSEASRSAR